MYFDPKDGMKPPPFKHTVYNALVVPRPIGWISTVDTNGVINLAPYSFFNALCGDPPCVMYCPNGYKTGTTEPKDSLTNVRDTGEFVFNMVTMELLLSCSLTLSSAPPSPVGFDESANRLSTSLSSSMTFSASWHCFSYVAASFRPPLMLANGGSHGSSPNSYSSYMTP